ncbi:TetR/AcrR family transcriptional regulator [Kocuria sp.]|uniref:TetR/AcrR family transcriptional regulator n=1 Tax=Kocuria sp. TaxID=1871328 RepID=UPI0026DEC671|nr:TetR/AcrR family transcriptional regulator [Kocuria sp.]MDO5619486.1 TetR/AcrR family transcriptional regulator [Kocuria sp.]
MNERPDRRRVRTRQSLISAAQSLLSQGRTSVSIQEITEQAQVGFGSFYNHFESKEQLFQAAVEETIASWLLVRDEAVEDITDPAEVVSTSFHVAGRFQRAHPRLTRILLSSSSALLGDDKGFRQRGIKNINQGIATHRFDPISPEISFTIAATALLGLMHHLDLHPEAEVSSISAQFAERVLIMLGLTHTQAGSVAYTPESSTTRADPES